MPNNLIFNSGGDRLQTPHAPNQFSNGKKPPLILSSLGFIFFLLLALGWFSYTACRIEVPAKHIAILLKKTGLDLKNNQEIAPTESYKGVQAKVLSEGRYFYNPWNWQWEVVPMFEVPASKLGVAVRLQGEDLGYGEIIAWEKNQKGIEPEVLRPGRYPINSYSQTIELHDPITIPAGYKGVVTLLAAPMPKDPNKLLVEKGTRGVQKETLNPGTYYLNPYVTRVSLVDCRSQRFNLAHNNDMGFPSKDGFWVSLNGIIEFRIKPSHAAEVFVTYNDNVNGDRVDEEIRKKIIMPNARSFCRLRGSNNSGRDFIGGETRIKFQKEFQDAMREACDPLGIEILQALITEINPPQRIASPVREREVARQKRNQFKQQILQQKSEIKLAIEKELVKRSQALVLADQKVVTMVVESQRQQEVAVTKANEHLLVAAHELDAAKDQAAAIVERGKADADVIMFKNEAQAAGWKRAVDAFGGDGNAFARYVLYKVLAPGYNSIMVNTANSPMMDVFGKLGQSPTPKQSAMPTQ